MNYLNEMKSSRLNVARVYGFPLMVVMVLLSLWPMFTLSENQPVEVRGVPVIVYHEIVDDDRPRDDVIMSTASFEEQMNYLAEHDYKTLTIDELIAFMREENTVPERCVVLTFDDGWWNATNALPILEKYGFKASFWIITGKGYESVYMDWDTIAAIDMNPNIEAGSHTVNHPWDPDSNLITWLDGVPEGKGLTDVIYQLGESKAALERHLGRPVTCLAWPKGWYNEELIALARQAGYQALLTVDGGLNKPGDDVLRIRRTMVDGRWNLEQFSHFIQSDMADPPVK